MDDLFALSEALNSALKPYRFEGKYILPEHSLFYGCETAITGERWNVDIWFRKKAEIIKTQEYCDSIRKSVSDQPSLGRAVTEIKQELIRLNLYGIDKSPKRHYHSKEIYDAVFEEGILELPSRFGEEKYIKVHPDFRAILTSNSVEYAGVHVPQDALLDRMVGIYMDYYSFETEVQIVNGHTGLSEKESEKIVSSIRKIRDQTNEAQKPGIRSGIMVGKAVKNLNGNVKDYFEQLFVDVIATKTSSNAELLKKKKLVIDVISELNSENTGSNAEPHRKEKPVNKAMLKTA